MPQLSTGLVIAGAYADKVRRVLFAQQRDLLKKGEIDPQTIAKRSAELNRLLFDILVNKLKLDKGDVVRIRIEYDVEDHDIKWRLDTLQIEVFKRVPDEEVQKAIQETIEKAEEVLAAPVTGEEREWRGEEVEETKPEVKEETPPAPPAEIALAQEIGETVHGERLFALRDSSDRNIGLAIISGEKEKAKLTIILVPKPHEAYIAEQVIEKDPASISENNLLDMISELTYTKIEPKRAEDIIKEKMLNIR